MLFATDFIGKTFCVSAGRVDQMLRCEFIFVGCNVASTCYMFLRPSVGQKLLMLAREALRAENIYFNADALDSLDQARSDTENYRNRFSMQGGSSNLSLEDHKARAKESFARLQV